MDSQLVTIGIPTRNRSGYLINAVRSALSQKYTQVEVVVSDNASTDDTQFRIADIKDSRLVYLRQSENLGMIGNFNAVLSAAKGSLFLMLSDDDLLEPDSVEQLSRPFLAPADIGGHSDIGLTWCPCVIVNSNGTPMWTSDGGPPLETSSSLVIKFAMGERGPRFCSIMVRTADAVAVGGYNGERYGALCDVANWAMAALRYNSVACIQRPLVKNMVHPASATSRGACRDWQCWGERMIVDLYEPLRGAGVSDREMRVIRRNLIANLTAFSLLSNVGQPGWFPYCAHEIAKGWRNFLTLGVARRVMRETWKIARFWQRKLV